MILITLSDLEQDFFSKELKEQVAIRGFLYQNEQGAWILADQPNLRSCCMQKQPHLAVEGNFLHPSFTRPVEVIGHLEYEKEWILKRAHSIESTPQLGGTLWLLPLAAMACGIYYWSKRK